MAKFLSLNKRLDNLDRVRSRPRRSGKRVFWMFTALIAAFLLVYLPVRGAYNSAKSIIGASKSLSVSLKNSDFGGIKKDISDMKKSANSLELSLNFLYWVRAIPFIGPYYSDMRKFSQAVKFDLTAMNRAIEILEPRQNEIGLSNVSSNSPDRVAQFVKILNIILPRVSEIEPDLKHARDSVSGVDVSKYPETFRGYRVRSLAETAKNFITGVHFAVTGARDALEATPEALGEPSAKTYLLIFQNDKEIRATGGFMTAYAFLKLDGGKISSSVSDDIYRLDEKLLKTCLTKICPLRPPEPIVKYLPEANGKPRTAWAMRDANLSPDLPTSMQQFEKMYDLLGEGLPFDGIILIDTHVVEDLIKITGDIEVFGTRYGAGEDERCNCPNVIYELESYAQIIEKGQEDRKAILGTLMQQILARSLGASSEKFPEFVNAGVKLANSKHIMFFMHDDQFQRALSRLGWTGEIKGFDGDYLHINDSNFAGGKSNMYVMQDVELDIKIDKSGKVRNKLSIKYSNGQKYSSWLNGINRDYVRVYVPKGSKLVSSRGSEVNVTTIDDDLGKTVFEAFIQVRPQNSTNLFFEYELPNLYSLDKYPLLIQKQPGAGNFKYEIKINGDSKAKFALESDKELSLSR